MQVIDHEPSAWFLFSEDDQLFLDVSCNNGPVGYSVLIPLDANEHAKFQAGGHEYVDQLANRIRESAPLVRGSMSVYSERDVSRLRGEHVLTAVSEWRKTRAAPAPDQG
ncbi:hypothetical protein L2Y96_12150 [Luteibacter aegosomaticola]|uniref:hypothetical protein n=1 Tax=Luteibacter aegosomaticola TaxID=2911538 RepID=UPI001FFBD72B|nr:hypothetical protein [Luteibacter aegosomaticola]UPG88171.1 hypothetical protein L2Y96_12150 [Luteibacter aegosomaticola]